MKNVSNWIPLDYDPGFVYRTGGNHPKRISKGLFGMKVLFRRADDSHICYARFFAILPKKTEAGWKWLCVLWVKASFIEFDMIDGNQWSYRFLTKGGMVQERLTYNLIKEDPIERPGL